MTNLAASFRSLTKNNNGFFKSKNQADFLISKTDNKLEFTVSESVYGNSYLDIFQVDARGVTKVIRSSKKADKVIWERDNSIPVSEAMEADKARKDTRARVVKIHNAARSIAAKAHKLQESKATSIVNFMNSIDPSNLDDVKALTAYSEKTGKIINNGLAIASRMRDKADSMK